MEERMQQRLVYIETTRWILLQQLAYEVHTYRRDFLSESFIAEIRILAFDLLKGLLSVW